MTLKKRCCAYTLIEVLVAMMILALSLTVIFRIFSGGLRNIGVASDYARAVMVAESVLAATGRTERLQPGEINGSLFDRYRWVRTISPYRPDGELSYDNSPVNAYRVSVVVEWPATGSPRSLDLSTLQLATSSGVGGSR